MNDVKNLKGQCLCGAVKLELPDVPPKLGACHCTMCRSWSGGPLMTLQVDEEIHFSGEDNIAIFNSSDWAERGFCKTCGSNLFYRLKQQPIYYVLAGLFKFDSSARLDHQVFIDEKPHFYNFAEKTHTMTSAEVFAMFGDG